MDDIISWTRDNGGSTVRMIAPQHFEQYWQAGVLANKTDFEMNIHGPYYSELLGDKLRENSLTKIEALFGGKSHQCSTYCSPCRTLWRNR